MEEKNGSNILSSSQEEFGDEFANFINQYLLIQEGHEVKTYFDL